MYKTLGNKHFKLIFKHSISPFPQTDYKEAQRDKNIFYKRKQIHIIKYLLGERTL